MLVVCMALINSQVYAFLIKIRFQPKMHLYAYASLVFFCWRRHANDRTTIEVMFFGFKGSFFLVLQPKNYLYSCAVVGMSTYAKKTTLAQAYKCIFRPENGFYSKSVNLKWSVPCTLPSDKVSKKVICPFQQRFYASLDIHIFFQENRC